LKRIILMVTVALVMAVMMAVAGPASATIHPIVESFDCVGTDVPEGHPIGDVADPPGQTPEFGSHSEQSSLRAINAVTDDFTDFSSPALSEHKLDGQCGKVGQ
jgi:hypothetical protein